MPTEIVGLGFLADGTLITATNQGLFHGVAADESGSDALVVVHDTGLALRGFTIFNNRWLVAYLTDTGVVHRSDVAARRFVDQADPVVRLFDGPPPSEQLEGSGSWESRDLLHSCGDDYFAAERVDGSAAWAYGNLTTLPTLGNRLLATTINQQSAVCAEGVLVTATPGRSAARSTPLGLPIPRDVTVDSIFDRLVLAANADGSALGVVRPNGLVDLVDVSEAGTSRDAGSAVVVLPFEGSSLLIDGDGLISRVQTSEQRLELGVGTTPFPIEWDFVRIADHYVLAGDDGLVTVFEDGRTEARRTEVRGRLGLCGEGIVCVADEKSVIVFDSSSEDTIDLTPVLGDSEYAYEAHGLGGRDVVVGTTSGTVILINRETHEEVDRVPSSADGPVSIATATEKGMLFAFGPDGVLSAYDRDLDLLRRRLIGPPGYSIRTACDDSLLVLAPRYGDVLLIDAETLLTLLVIPTNSTGSPTYTDTPGACRQIVGLNIDRRRNSDGESETEFRLKTIPIGVIRDTIG